MKEMFLKYKEDGLGSSWVEVQLNVDAIRIESNGNTFEITPTKERLGAFTIKCVTPAASSVNFIAESESVEVTFHDPEGVEVY